MRVCRASLKNVAGYYQYRDRLNSSVIEANELGQVISYEEYYPYGRSAYRAVASGVDLSLKRYRFTGKERDEETGLDYFGVRYYASWLGRWTSGDPGGFVDGLNLYRYVRNNPVNGVDNLGYETEPPPITFPKNPIKGQTYTPGAEQGTNWTYVYGGEKDGWMPLGDIGTITVIPQEEIVQEITTGSFWGDLLMGEIPIVGTAIDLYNAYAAFQNGDYLGAALNALSAVPLAGVAAKLGKKAWKTLSPYLDDFVEGHKQIGRDIKSGLLEAEKKLNDWLDGFFPRRKPATAGSDIPTTTPIPSRPTQPQKPQQHKMEGDGPGGGDPPKKNNDPPKDKEVTKDEVDDTDTDPKKSKKKKKKKIVKRYMSFAEAARDDANNLLKYYKKTRSGNRCWSFWRTWNTLFASSC